MTTGPARRSKIHVGVYGRGARKEFICQMSIALRKILSCPCKYGVGNNAESSLRWKSIQSSVAAWTASRCRLLQRMTYTLILSPLYDPQRTGRRLTSDLRGRESECGEPLGSLADHLLTAAGSPLDPGPRILDPELLTEHFRIPDHTHPLEQQGDSRPIIGCGSV